MPPEYGQFNRHYNFAKELSSLGHEVNVIVGSKLHNTNIQMIKDKRKFLKYDEERFGYYFVKTIDYSNSKIKRLIAMFQYYFNAKRIMKTFCKQDVVIGSSAHPLAAYLAIKQGAKQNALSLVEIRDLWPESIVAYSKFSKKNLLIKFLYHFEKWLYKKADKIIFTMEGGKDYIKDQRWDIDSGGKVDLNKIYHINNGVDLNTFNNNILSYQIDDKDLDSDKFKVVYTGSIRKANNVKKIILTAEYINKVNSNVLFLIYGDGTERKELQDYCKKKSIKSELNIFHFKQTDIKKYGASLNKMFEYFASGKPIITDCEFGYDLVKKYNAGIVIDDASPEEWGDEIIKLSNLNEHDYDLYCENSLRAAKDYDFKKLTKKLLDIIER
jgi:glycosyltransferase involved in cell wall biosynthesis